MQGRGSAWARNFRIARVKILISKSLSGGDLCLSSQNLEPERLTHKILRNKYLALEAWEIAATPFGCGNDQIFGRWNARADVTGSRAEAVEKSSSLVPGTQFFVVGALL